VNDSNWGFRDRYLTTCRTLGADARHPAKSYVQLCRPSLSPVFSSAVSAKFHVQGLLRTTLLPQLLSNGLEVPLYTVDDDWERGLTDGSTRWEVFVDSLPCWNTDSVTTTKPDARSTS